MVSQTSPWKQHHYVGEYANDAGADAAVTALGWGTTQGLLYYDTTLNVFKGNSGAAWFVIGGPSSDTFTATIVVGNSVAGDVAGVNCHVVNDIAAGLALMPVGGGILHIKRGTYSPASGITVASSITVQGEDAGTIIQKPEADNVFEVLAASSDIGFRNLTFDGQADEDGGHMIDIVASSDILIEACVFQNAPGGTVDSYGVNVEGSIAVGTSQRIGVHHCLFDAVTRGLEIISTDFAAQAVKSIFDIEISHCTITNADKEGIRATHLDRLSITDVRVIDPNQSIGGRDGVLLRGSAAQSAFATNLLVDGLYIVNSDDDGLELEEVADSSFVKVVSVDNTADGINMNNVDRSSFIGCVCRNNTDDGMDLGATSDRNIIIGCQLTGNGDNALEDTGTNNIKANNIIA